MEIYNDCKDIGLSAGIITGESVSVDKTPQALSEKLLMLVKERKCQEFPPQRLKDEVRGLLRKGGFKPSGRNKPASEYLAQAAREGRFPFINNLVDINNYLSLLTGLPMTMLDLDISGDKIVLRPGRIGENFVFNASGQVIDVEGLICTCKKDGSAIGNPVKDSVEAKVKDTTTRLLGVIYAPSASYDIEELKRITHMFAEMLEEYAKAMKTEEIIV